MSKKKVAAKSPKASVSKGGSEIIRHDAPAASDSVVPMQLTEREMRAIEAFYTKRFGPSKDVLHEVFSPDIHIDVIPIPASKKSKLANVATMGMSAAPMNSPRGYPKYAELTMQLPKDWQFDEKALSAKGGKFYWPIEWIKSLARLPVSFDTFLDSGHTVPMDGMSSTACPFACALIIPLLGVTKESDGVVVAGRKKIYVYSVVPLFAEEMDMKLEQGIESLLDAMDAAGLQPWNIASPARVNVAKAKKSQPTGRAKTVKK